MQIIQRENELIEKILGEQIIMPNTPCRTMRFSVSVAVPEGKLIYNILTKELVLIDSDEENDEYLLKHWFKVPYENEEELIVLQVRELARLLTRRTGQISDYTILTTTKCNARCFYCYEKNKKQESMTDETAQEVVDFIKRNQAETININWFGGEPLFNEHIIDIISDGMQAYDFKSSMITNGYLFDEIRVKKALSLWHLKRVQITLDGTEDTYNKYKSYIYTRDESPFIRVTDNIELLLKAGIEVNIRLNMDKSNCDDLSALIEYLGIRFGKYELCDVYTSILYQCVNDSELQEKRNMLEEKVKRLGLRKRKTLTNRHIKFHQCQADSDSSIIITPSGGLSKCEHQYDSDKCGNVRDGITDFEIINQWRQYMPLNSGCKRCPVFPNCIRIDKCELFLYHNKQCSPYRKGRMIEDIKELMLNTYQEFKIHHNEGYYIGNCETKFL